MSAAGLSAVQKITLACNLAVSARPATWAAKGDLADFLKSTGRGNEIEFQGWALAAEVAAGITAVVHESGGLAIANELALRWNTHLELLQALAGLLEYARGIHANDYDRPDCAGVDVEKIFRERPVVARALAALASADPGGHAEGGT